MKLLRAIRHEETACSKDDAIVDSEEMNNNFSDLSA